MGRNQIIIDPAFLFDVKYQAYKNSLNSLQRKLLKSLTGLDKRVENLLRV
jgi:hypothetical protein